MEDNGVWSGNMGIGKAPTVGEDVAEIYKMSFIIGQKCINIVLVKAKRGVFG